MLQKNSVVVLLHRQAIDDLGRAIEPYLSYGAAGPYLKCREVNPNGPFFHITLDVPGENSKLTEVEMQMPHGYVKLILSGDRDIHPGFTS